jgi:hypothetical protein
VRLFTTRGMAMQKKTIVVALVMLIAAGMLVNAGCSRPKASGKLQIMFSGNIRGNVSPCG